MFSMPYNCALNLPNIMLNDIAYYIGPHREGAEMGHSLGDGFRWALVGILFPDEEDMPFAASPLLHVCSF